MASKRYIDLIDECDNFSYAADSLAKYYALRTKDCPVDLGYILSDVAAVISAEPGWQIDHEQRLVTLVTGDTEPSRTTAVAKTTASLRQSGKYSVLTGWRNELYPVYGLHGELLFSVERAASPLFGILTFGCHMTAYVQTSTGLKIWVPRRAANKSTYGGMLDNTVAGGLATGENTLQCITREAEEEASLPADLVRSSIKAVGAVTYFHVRDERAGGEIGLMQPECEFVFDLELPEDILPKPRDGEVQSFELMAIDEVQHHMKAGGFKPNCALVLLDFFVRHGILTADEPSYLEIVARTHRKLDFPTM